MWSGDASSLRRNYATLKNEYTTGTKLAGTEYFDASQSASGAERDRYYEVRTRLDMSWKTFRYNYFLYTDPLLAE